MKAKTLQKRIENRLYTKKGGIACKYATALWFISSNLKKVHLVRWAGRPRCLTLSDSAHHSTVDALALLGIDFVCGNDAPRGGKEGEYIELTAKGLRQVADFRKL